MTNGTEIKLPGSHVTFSFPYDRSHSRQSSEDLDAAHEWRIYNRV